MTEVFSPDDVIRGKADHVHPDVAWVVNARLMKTASVRGNTSSATLRQDDVVADLNNLGHDNDTIYREGMLDFEAAYRARGWAVVYEKADYNSTGSSYWTFTAAQS